MTGEGDERPSAVAVGLSEFGYLPWSRPASRMIFPCQATTGQVARSSAEIFIRFRISFTFFGPRQRCNSTRSPGFHARTCAHGNGVAASCRENSGGQLAVNLARNAGASTDPANGSSKVQSSDTALRRTGQTAIHAPTAPPNLSPDNSNCMRFAEECGAGVTKRAGARSHRNLRLCPLLRRQRATPVAAAPDPARGDARSQSPVPLVRRRSNAATSALCRPAGK